MSSSSDPAPRELAAALADLARRTAATTDLDLILKDVTTTAVAVIDGADAADVLVVATGTEFGSHAPTSDLAQRLDLVQATTHQGPCVDAAFDDVVIRSDDLTTETRWPQFCSAALDLGVRSVLSFNLFTSNQNVGALNLLGYHQHAFTAEDEEVGLMLATHTAIALHALHRSTQFESALASRDVIGQAKGMLMERFNVDAVHAFTLLSRLSQESNIKLAVLAQQLVDTDHPSAP